MAGMFKRSRPKEADPIDEINPSPQLSSTNSTEPSDNTEKTEAFSTSRSIEEGEANRKLAAFEKAHRWDPNLDDDQLLEIDDAVNARDPNTEHRIYEEVFENSPYPEVSATILVL
jgi:hypothetical protein